MKTGVVDSQEEEVEGGDGQMEEEVEVEDNKK